ncbi:MAG: carboxypeptidase regulatory-like domain-containing protein [Acidobacteriia bacterium]|nr:carboxypeptidase regulatory-like domain-containing protein [Terriglobia bacterium]
MRAALKIYVIHILSLLLLVAVCTRVQGQSALNLPRLFDQGGRFTGIAISNPSNRSAAIRLQLYDESGNAIGLPAKGAVLKLGPGAQMAQFDNQLFSLPANFRGWAQIVSDDNSNLRGFYLVGDEAVTVLDGTNGAQAYREQILPFLANDANTDTEINIVNPSDQSASISLLTITSDGTVSPFGTTGLTLQPHAVFRRSTKEIFSSRNYTEGSYFSITSNVALLAMELVENHAEPALACLNGVNVNAAGRVINFPHAVLGGDYFSILGVINLLDIAQTVSMSLYQQDGVLLNTGSIPNPVSVTLNPKASLRKSLVDLFGLGSALTSVTGVWVKVEANFGPISGFIAYGNFSNPTLAAVAPQVRPLNEMVFSHLAPQALGYFTGVALLNVNADAASVRLTAIDRNGVTVSMRDLRLDPNQKIAQTVADLLPAAKDQVGGSLVVVSDQPLFAVELFGSTNFSVLANVPPDDITASYVPLDLGKFVLSGKLAQENGAPLARAAVRLSGSVQGSTVTTDENGEYVFLNIPAGNYAVEPTLKNFEFTPTALSVSVNNSNVGDADFQGKRLPILAVTSISPPNGPVGSPVTLRGTGFSLIAGENVVHFFGTFGSAAVLNSPPPTDDAITVLVPGSARTGGVVVSVGSNVSNQIQFSVTQGNSTSVQIPSATPSSVAISGLGNLALVGHSERGTISLVSLTPNPGLVQDLTFSTAANAEILSVATDDDGRGGGTSRDDDIGFFNIEEVAFKALRAKVAKLGAKIDRPELSQRDAVPLTTSDVQFVQLPRGSNPVSLAFEPFGRFAMTANRGTDSVSFVEFIGKLNPTIRGTLSLPAGSQPVSVSVAANGTRALVANGGTNSVSVIEFAPAPGGFLSGNLQPVITRNFLLNSRPNSVAINLDAARGVTANADNTASILDLNGPADDSAVTTFTLPKFSPGPPTAVSVALAPNGSYAIVTSRDPDGNAYLSILSLEGIPEVAFVQVLPSGAGTSAVTIGPNSSSILVANPRLGNVSVFNPVPGNVSLDTLSLSRSQVKQTVTLFGTGFSPDSKNNVVRFRGKSQTTIPAPVLSMSSSHEITVEVPVDAISGPVTVNVGRASSNEQFFVILPEGQQSLAPSIDSVTPRTLSRGSDSRLLISGNGFNAQSIVEVDLGDGAGPQRLTSLFGSATVTILSPHGIQVLIPGSDLRGTPSRITLDVFNPPPGGGRSNSFPISIVGTPDIGPIRTP